jgi:hypothetical protein
MFNMESFVLGRLARRGGPRTAMLNVEVLLRSLPLDIEDSVFIVTLERKTTA